MRGRRGRPALSAWWLLVAATAIAAAPQAAIDIGSATAPRGAVGEIVFEYAGPPLCAKADQAEAAPILVRLVKLEEPASAAGSARYRLTFLGAVAGEYDLLPLIEHCDGRPVADLSPIRVQVFSQLPELHGTDVYREDRPLPRISGHYRLLMGLLLAAWLLVPIVVLVRRRLNRKPSQAPVAAEPPPTLADQLRPLVNAAMQRGLSIAEQARLELLLLRFWRDRLGLGDLPPADAVARLRRDPQAGALLVAVERWLHDRRGAGPRPEQDVAALLAPYREAPAYDEAVPAAEVRA